MKNELAGDLSLAESKNQYDDKVKRVLSNKIILAWILKYVTEEFTDMSVDEIKSCISSDIEVSEIGVVPGWTNRREMEKIRGEAQEDAVPGEGEIYYDIRFSAYLKSREERIKLLINVEAQKAFYPGYSLTTRGIFYGARMISAQKGTEFTGRDYDNIRKVYSIWICMNAPAYIGNAMAEYRITKEDLVGNITEQRESYDKLSVVIICLHETGGADCAGTLHGFLNVLLSPVLAAADKEKLLTQDFGMKMEYELREELRQMCILSESIEEKGLERGILLTQKVMRLSAGGMSDEDIAKVSLITREMVHEILEA